MDGRLLDPGDLDPGDLDRCDLDSRGLDPQQPYHLAWLRDRPRPELRHHQHRTSTRHPGNSVPGRAVQRLPGSNDGLELQLDAPEPEGRRLDAQWQYQPG